MYGYSRAKMYLCTGKCTPHKQLLFVTSFMQLTANYTCKDQASQASATTTVSTVRPELTLRLTPNQPAARCSNEPAIARFRYNVARLQPNQSFDLTAAVGKGCTASSDYSELQLPVLSCAPAHDQPDC
jgi:hypothetical protein